MQEIKLRFILVGWRRNENYGRIEVWEMFWKVQYLCNNLEEENGLGKRDRSYNN